MSRTASRLSFYCLCLGLMACSDKRVPDYNPDVGPFDEDGNYIEAWADNPPPRRSKRRQTSKTPPKTDDRVAVLPKPSSQSKPTTTRPTPPKPKPMAKPTPRPKPKPKPKPKPVVVKPKKIRHTVKKGETLYGLSRRYGVSVAAIQKANSLKGNLIKAGSVLVIPK